MRGFLKVVGGFAVVCASVFLFLLWNAMGYWPIPKTHGLIEAHFDLAHGRYKILGYGLPLRGMDKYISLLHERYGVDYRAVAGCTVSKDLVDYANAYDSVSEPAINRKFGHDIFKEVASETLSFRRQSP